MRWIAILQRKMGRSPELIADFCNRKPDWVRRIVRKYNAEGPEGVHLVVQPAYSPDVQPAERLWPLLRESLSNRDFVDINEHREVTAESSPPSLRSSAPERSCTGGRRTIPPKPPNRFPADSTAWPPVRRVGRRSPL
jgi:hypothetical protein